MLWHRGRKQFWWIPDPHSVLVRDIFGGAYTPCHKEEKFPFMSENFSQEIFHMSVLFRYWIKCMGLYPCECFSWKKSNNHICSMRKLTKTGCENLTEMKKTLNNMLSGILLHVKGDGLWVLMGLCRADWKMEFPFYKKLWIFQHLGLSQIRIKSLNISIFHQGNTVWYVCNKMIHAKTIFMYFQVLQLHLESPVMMRHS